MTNPRAAAEQAARTRATNTARALDAAWRESATEVASTNVTKLDASRANQPGDPFSDPLAGFHHSAA